MKSFNDGNSAAGLCCKVAAFVPDMFCKFKSARNNKIANNLTITKAREKISTDLKSLEF